MSTLYHNLQVTIHSNLADLAAYALESKKEGKNVHGYSAMLLYYLCRGIDIHWDADKERMVGSGKVVINIDQVAAILGKTPSTIRKYLVDGVKLGFFRGVKRCGNTVTIYYNSLHNIAASFGLDSLGVFAEIPVSEIKHLKHWGTQATMQHLQNASRFQAKKKLPKREKVAQPEDILLHPTNIEARSKAANPNAAKPIKKCDRVSESEINQWAKNVVYRSDGRTFVDSHFTMFGVSQVHIADKTNRSVSTVYRRLGNHPRSVIGSAAKGTLRPRGLSQLPQTQLAGFIVGGVKQSDFAHIQLDLEKTFWSAGALWKSGCNIYERQLDLKSGIASKFWYGRRLEKMGSASIIE